jgi:hypothetical protein
MKMGIATEDELMVVVAEMQDLAQREDVLVAPWGMPGVWAVK